MPQGCVRAYYQNTPDMQPVPAECDEVNLQCECPPALEADLRQKEWFIELQNSNFTQQMWGLAWLAYGIWSPGLQPTVNGGIRVVAGLDRLNTALREKFRAHSGIEMLHQLSSKLVVIGD